MVFLEGCEILLQILIVLAGVTQILIPLWKGTALFPFFKKEKQLVEELVQEKQTTAEEALRAAIENEKLAREADSTTVNNAMKQEKEVKAASDAKPKTEKRKSKGAPKNGSHLK